MNDPQTPTTESLLQSLEAVESAMPARPPETKSKRRQKKQSRRAIPAGMPRLTDRVKLNQAKRWTSNVLAIKPRRYLEIKTGRSGAWWEKVAAGDFDQVRVTLVDWYVIHAIADIVADEGALDADILNALMRVMERNAAIVVAVTDLIAAVRRKTKTVKNK